ncbi:tubulin-specific chaperone C [Hyperolius riggenbachi]|uniref:tubulin-specific chaperone C n=1 Tax=Hyperolius riggenbachi TaxID=752182 RepID=UPI0035A28761
MEAGGAVERPRVPERLQRRDEERLRETEKRRQDREAKTVEEEKSGHFRAAFELERAAIEAALSGEEADGEPLEEVSARVQRLQKLLNDSMMFLASYDVRQAQEQLSRLQASLEARREQLQPKKKFTFKSRKKEGAAPSSTSQPAEPPRAKEIHVSHCGLQGLSGQALSMEAQEIRQKDVLLTQLRDCTVTLPGSPATLHIRDLSGCRVLSGPVSSSIFVDNCRNCVFAFPCQQLRTHSTTDSQFYIHVTSRAIIEDCRGVTFAPFTWSYPEMEQDYELAGLDKSRNNWDQVDDFNWLAKDVKSPNWSLIPEVERITHWN